MKAATKRETPCYKECSHNLLGKPMHHNSCNEQHWRATYCKPNSCQHALLQMTIRGILAIIRWSICRIDGGAIGGWLLEVMDVRDG